MKKLISNNKIPKRELKKSKFSKVGIKSDEDKIQFDGKKLINLSSNDYLGLSSNKKILNKSVEYLKNYGNSSSSSRLIAGNFNKFEEIETNLSKQLGFSKSIIMGNGFLVNATVIPAITKNTIGKKNRFSIFSDKLNHASINYGNSITKQKVFRYNHLDLNHLELLIKKSQTNTEKIIISESLYSMDGDFADIDGLRFIANKYNAILYIDEAHSFGLYGKEGLGKSTNGLRSEREVMIGTFSKALGSYGAFVSCSNDIYDLVVESCPGLIYSTALPPSVVGSIKAGINILPKLSKKRERLIENSKFLIKKLKELNLNVGNTSSHIIPIILSNFSECEKLRKELKRKNFFVKSFRHPTVPKNEERIRVSLTAFIKKNVIIDFLKVMENFK